MTDSTREVYESLRELIGEMDEKSAKWSRNYLSQLETMDLDSNSRVDRDLLEDTEELFEELVKYPLNYKGPDPVPISHPGLSRKTHPSERREYFQEREDLRNRYSGYASKAGFSSREEVARAAGVNEILVRMVEEAGFVPTRRDAASRIAEALKISPEELYGKEI